MRKYGAIVVMHGIEEACLCAVNCDAEGCFAAAERFAAGVFRMTDGKLRNSVAPEIAVCYQRLSESSAVPDVCKFAHAPSPGWIAGVADDQLAGSDFKGA